RRGRSRCLTTLHTVIRALTVVVRVVAIDFDISKHWAEPILYGTQEDWSTNLKTILECPVFYKRRPNSTGIYELNFDEDEERLFSCAISKVEVVASTGPGVRFFQLYAMIESVHVVENHVSDQVVEPSEESQGEVVLDPPKNVTLGPSHL
ncbi:hypothetical protein M8C21_017163, partial [Ambrosia artemisiifolia]